MIEGQHTKYLFLSHNSLDKPEVEPFIQQIESHPLAQQHHLKVWVDKDSLNNDSGFPAQLADAIAKDTCALVLYLGKQPMTEWVLDEVNHAKKRNIDDRKTGLRYPIIPVYPGSSDDGAPLPTSICTFSFLQHVYADSQQIARLITLALGLESPQTATTHQTQGLSRLEIRKRQMAEQRLETLYQQLDAMQKQRDLETRVEEQMRLDAIIDAKTEDIRNAEAEFDLN